MTPVVSRALVVDDERASRLNIIDLLTMEHFTVEEAEDGDSALKLIRSRPYDIILLDIRMPKMNGLDVLRHIKKSHPNLPVIMFTAIGTSERAIEAMKMGAFDYVAKPFDVEELLAIIRRAIEYRRLSTEVQALRQRLADVETQDFRPDKFVSGSAVMQRVFKLIGKVAASDTTVLIEGETGTGKELVANAIWYHSSRKERPLIKINCAALPEGLLESELFGHERGAFTDAYDQRKGHFELADGGTLFLDEISEMSPKLQSKLLRVLEQHEFQRVGGKDTLKVDVRILAATNRDLKEETKAGRFRKDLFYRLQVVHIELPPLRDRRGDIPPLVHHFLKRFGPKKELVVSPEAMAALEQYSWPGNVRELGNVIERATVLVQGRLITQDHLSLPNTNKGEVDQNDTKASETFTPLRTALTNLERDLILKALRLTNWNKSRAAKLLQIDRRVLFDKVKEYDLKP